MPNITILATTTAKGNISLNHSLKVKAENFTVRLAQASFRSTKDIADFETDFDDELLYLK